MVKKRLTTAWLQGCSGCHISLLDTGADLVAAAEALDVVYSPIADAREVPEADVALVEGAVNNSENEELLKLIRERTKTVVALGTCACHGGIQGLRNLHTVEDILETSYPNAPGDGSGPPTEDVPKLSNSVRPLSQVIEVDYMLPGCPPPTASIAGLLAGLLQGEVALLPTHNLCEECDRRRDKVLVAQRGFIIDSVQAVCELDEIDEEMCFLEQGVLCMGPMTREGCGAKCLAGNMPCRGCMGPTPSAPEQGCKLIDSLASILPAGAIMYLEDVVGTGYRFSLPVSIYPKLTDKKGGKQ